MTAVASHFHSTRQQHCCSACWGDQCVVQQPCSAPVHAQESGSTLLQNQHMFTPFCLCIWVYKLLQPLTHPQPTERPSISAKPVPVLTGAVSSGSAALSSAPSRQPTRGKPAPPDWRSPVYALIVAQLAAYLLFNVLALTPPAALGLSLRSPQWWQGLTSGFAFTGWQHLAESVFLTYIFGRLLERAHGAWGLWLAFLASVVGESNKAATAAVNRSRPMQETGSCGRQMSGTAGSGE